MEVARTECSRPLVAVALLFIACGGGPGNERSAGAVVAVADFDITSVFSLRVAIDADDNIVLAGLFCGSIDLGGDMIGGPLLSDAGLVVASFDANFEHRWSRIFSNACSGVTNIGLATTPGGDVILSIDRYEDSIDLGGGALLSKTFFELDVGAVARFAGSDGAHVWSRNTYTKGDADPIVPHDVTVDGLGQVVLTGRSWARLDAETTVSTGVVAALSPNDGSPIWSVEPWLDLSLRGSMVTATPDVLVATTAAVPFEGSGAITKLNPVDGSELWRVFAPRPPYGDMGVALDSAGDVLISYDLVASAVFGYGSGVYTVDKLSGVDGTHLWSWILGTGDDSGSVGAVTVTTDSMNNVAISGWFRGCVLIGERVLFSRSSRCDGSMSPDLDSLYADMVFNSLFVLKLDGNGQTLWSRYTESANFFSVGDVQIDGEDRILASGHAFGGNLTVPVSGLYLIRLAP